MDVNGSHWEVRETVKVTESPLGFGVLVYLRKSKESSLRALNQVIIVNVSEITEILCIFIGCWRLRDAGYTSICKLMRKYVGHWRSHRDSCIPEYS